MTAPKTIPQTAPILTVTWDTVIGARPTGYDHETGATDYEPIDLGAAVIETIANKLIVDIKRDANDGFYRSAVQEVRNAAREAIQAEAIAMVREALTGEFQPTNQYGERSGEPTTLRDLIRAEVTAFLNEKPPQRGYNDRPGGFRELLKAEVEAALQKDLRTTIQAARAEVTLKVQQSAAVLIAQAVKDGLR